MIHNLLTLLVILLALGGAFGFIYLWVLNIRLALRVRTEKIACDKADLRRRMFSGVPAWNRGGA